MGEVDRARDTKLNRDVAITMLPASRDGWRLFIMGATGESVRRLTSSGADLWLTEFK